MKSSEICTQAAELIVNKGLGKNRLFDGSTGAYCINGALNQAMSGSWDYMSYTDPKQAQANIITTALANRVAYSVPEDFRGYNDGVATLVFWNNKSERTADEVITVLREIAKEFEAEGN